MIQPPSELILRAASNAKKSVCLVAPFVKEHVFKRVIGTLSPSVSIALVTRWRPEEVAMGVSDLAVFEVACSRDNCRVFVQHDLHAKYYRFDECALVGSANLTAKALGLTEPANIELLLEYRPLRGFEETLLGWSRLATWELVDAVRYAADQIPVSHVPTGDSEHLEILERPTHLWCPKTRRPEDLFVFYEEGRESVSHGVATAATHDLGYLGVPSGLDEQGFDAVVRSSLDSTPLVTRIDKQLERPRRFGEMRQWLCQETSMSTDEATNTWQTMIRWFLYFYPHRYEIHRPAYSEIIRRKM